MVPSYTATVVPFCSAIDSIEQPVAVVVAPGVAEVAHEDELIALNRLGRQRDRVDGVETRDLDDVVVEHGIVAKARRRTEERRRTAQRDDPLAGRADGEVAAETEVDVERARLRQIAQVACIDLVCELVHLLCVDRDDDFGVTETDARRAAVRRPGVKRVGAEW